MKAVRIALLGLALLLLIVGVVSGTTLRHVVQIVPILLVAWLAPRWPAPVAAWLAIGLFSFWLAIMLLIWLFLLGISRIAGGVYTPVEIVLTVLLGTLSIVGIVRSAGEGRALSWPRRILTVATCWGLQAGVMAVSLTQPLASL